MELPEKIERVLTAFLQGQAWPAYFNSALVLPGESDADKTDQCIIVICGEALNEEPEYSGNFWFPVRIELRTPAVLQTSAEKGSADPAQNTSELVKHQAVMAVLSPAIIQDSLVPNLNTTANAQNDDSKNFAAIGIIDRRPLREQADDYHLSGFEFRLYACSNPSAQ